jgi:hypothetical protein
VFSFVVKGILIMFSFSMCKIWIILNINVYRLVNIIIRDKLLLLLSFHYWFSTILDL